MLLLDGGVSLQIMDWILGDWISLVPSILPYKGSSGSGSLTRYQIRYFIYSPLWYAHWEIVYVTVCILSNKHCILPENWQSYFGIQGFILQNIKDD
jgi:hypothetical protein